MTIRPATRADVPAIVRLLADDPIGARREDPSDPLPTAYAEAFEAIDADPHNHLVVIDDDGEIVGTLQLTVAPYLTYRGGWRATIEGVRVASHQRDRGHGRDLVDWAVAEAARLGCHVVQLTTDKRRGDAQRFYRSLGFEASHDGMKRFLSGDVRGR